MSKGADATKSDKALQGSQLSLRKPLQPAALLKNMTTANWWIVLISPDKWWQILLPRKLFHRAMQNRTKHWDLNWAIKHHFKQPQKSDYCKNCKIISARSRWALQNQTQRCKICGEYDCKYGQMNFLSDINQTANIGKRVQIEFLIG